VESTDGDKSFSFHWYLYTPRLGTDELQSTAWQWESDAFGNSEAQIETVVVNLRFPGQYRDVESGLFYNWNRYYDPEIGRYVTSDPIGLSGGVNTYGYVYQNPNKYCATKAFRKASRTTFSQNINPDLPRGEDKKAHCYASCLISDCLLGIPIAPSIGVLKEILDIYNKNNEIDDIRANNVGIRYSYEGKDCFKACDGPDTCK